MGVRDAISATVDATGGFITIVFQGMATGGTLDLGLGANLDPSGAKLAVLCTSPAFTDAGAPTAVTRTIVGDPDKQFGACRLKYPNQALPDIVDVGGNAAIRFALSDNVYTDDSNITVSISTGLYTVSGQSNNGISSLAVTNNTTNTYAETKCLGNWLTLNRLVQVGSSLYVECEAFNRFAKDGKPVACVVFTVTDQHGHTVTATATSMAVSPANDYKKVLVYAATISLATMTDGDLLTISFKAYPWVGVAASCLDTNDGANTYPTPLYTNLVYRYDAVGDHGHCVLAVDGNDSTGTVYASQAAAEAAYAGDPTKAFLTIDGVAGALVKLRTYNNANAGHDDCGGGNIYCKAGSFTVNHATYGGSPAQFVTIQPSTGVNRANVTISAPANSARFPDHMRLKNVTITCAGTNFWSGNTTDSLVFEECDIQTAAPTTAYLVTNINYGALIRCTGLIPRGIKSLGGSPVCFAIVRGNTFDRLHLCHSNYMVVGNKNVIIADRTSTSNPFGDNMIYASNYVDSATLFDGTAYVAMLIDIANTQLAATPNHIVHGIAVIQNLFVRYGVTTVGLGGISYDGRNTNTNNVLFWNNQTVGGRINMGYADGNPTGSDDFRTHKNWSVKNNIFGDYNCKTDVFATNANNINNWPVRYWIGAGSNFIRSTAGDDWRGDALCGLWSKFGTAATPLDPKYVDDHSRHGTDAGPGGDYHLQSDSPAINASHDYILPFDIDGKARLQSGGSVGIYECATEQSTNTKSNTCLNGSSSFTILNGVSINTILNGSSLNTRLNGA